MSTTFENKRAKVKLPSNEQAVVDEFTGVLRKHQDEAPATLARLLNVAFDISLGTSERREHKLARAAIRGLETRQLLAEAEGGSLSSEDTSRLRHPDLGWNQDEPTWR